MNIADTTPDSTDDSPEAWAQRYQDSYQRQQAALVRMNVAAASGTDPVQAARDNALARSENVPPVSVPANRDALERQQKVRAVDADSMVRDAPATAAAMGNQATANAAQNEVNKLAQIEKIVRQQNYDPRYAMEDQFAPGVADDAIGAAATDAAQLGKSAYGYLAGATKWIAGMPLGNLATIYDKAHELMSGGTHTEAADWWFGKTVAGFDRIMDSAAVQKDAPFHQKVAATAGEMIPMLAAAVATGGANELPAAAGALETTANAVGHAFKAMAFPSLKDAMTTIDRVYENTGDALRAAQAGIAQYLVSTAGGAVPLSAPGRLLTRMGTGAVSGVLTGYESNAAMNAVLPPQMRSEFGGEDAALSALASAILGAPGHGGSEHAAIYDAVRKTYTDAADVESALQAHDGMANIGRLSAASTMREHDPQGFNQLVQQMTDLGGFKNVYVKGDVLAALMDKHGIDANDLMTKMPAVADQMREALHTGGDVQISVPDYATHIAGSAIEGDLLQNLKVGAGGKTFAEAQEYLAQQRERMAKVAQEAADQKEAADSRAQSLDAVRNDIASQIDATRLFRPEVAGQYAGLHTGIIDALAHTMGISPEAAYLRHGSTILGRAIPGFQPFAQGGLRDAYRWNAVSHNGVGPVYAGNRITLDAIHKISTEGAELPDFAPGGFAHHGIAGHAAKVTEGADTYVFNILDHDTGQPAGKLVGDVKDGKLVAIHDLASYNRKQGIGSETVAHIAANTHEPVRIVEALENARPFWDRLGAAGYDHTGDTTIDWRDASRYIEGRQGGVGSVGEGAAAERGGAGIDVSDATPQEIQELRRLGFRLPGDSFNQDRYTHDLFGDPLPAPPKDEPAKKSKLTNDEAPGTFTTRTEMVKDRTTKLAHDRIKTAADLARAVQDIGGNAVENLYAVVTDRYGKPLAKIGNYKGLKASVQLDLPGMVAESFRINGAANFWLVHNHPSGNPKLSEADTDASRLFDTAFAGSGIEYHGIMAVGAKSDGKQEYGYSHPNKFGEETGSVQPPGKSASVPSLERRFSDHSYMGPPIEGRSGFERAATKIANGESGIILVDYRQRPVGFVPTDSEDAAVRRSPRMGDLYRALSVSNASGAFIVDNGHGPAVSENLARFARASDLTVHDTIRKGPDGKWYGDATALTAKGSFKQERVSQTDTEAFKRWSNDAPLVTSADADTHDFKSGQKVVVEAYHGTQRPDRVGDIFRPGRSTSGPMAFHTSDPELASSYANNKRDTSLSREETGYENWYKFTPPGARRQVPLEMAWHYLTQEQKQKISELAPTIWKGENGDRIQSSPDNKTGMGGYDQHLKEARGNPLKALVEEWLNSGNLFDREHEFEHVLKLAGMPMDRVTFDSPNASHPFVYKNYIEMQKPLVTRDMPAEVMSALEDAAKRDRSKPGLGGADSWDKESITLREWVKKLNGGAGDHAWTSIPDKVTAVLKSLGYDGIIDSSGKNGGPQHPVYIPFESKQIKSGMGNNGRFGDTANILKQDAGQGPLGQYTPEGRIISILPHADASTFIHETGHWLLDVYSKLAMDPNAPERVRDDMGKVLKWMGVKDLDAWHSMSIDEQREHHEKFARGFERYLMEGKAPSLELQPMFARFRDWLLNVYQHFTNLGVDISDEVRQVMGRMLASEESIRQAEEARGYQPIMAERPPGMTDEDWNHYVALASQGSNDAIEKMQAASARDMRWLSGARDRAIREKQKEAEAARTRTRWQVAGEVWKQPVYQAWQYLTARENLENVPKETKRKSSAELDPTRDTMLTAIAKLGGLDQQELASQFGLKKEEHPPTTIFGKPAIRAKGKGHSIDEMAQLLAERGYISTDEHGKANVREFEDKFFNELSGAPEYSSHADWDFLMRGDREPTADDLKLRNGGRLSEAAVHSIDSEAAKALESRGMVSKDGYDPDTVAEMFGFKDGKDLVGQLAEARDPRDVIREMTDQRMLQEHGELSSPAAIARSAEAAIHNDARARFMATGLKILLKAPVSARALLAAAREAAESAISAKKVGDLKPNRFAIAEGKANREAIAKAAKEPREAIVAQRAALLNNQLFVAANKALADVQKGMDYLARFSRPDVRDKVNVAFRDQIDALLARYDLRRSLSPDQAQAKRTEKLSNFIEKLAKNGFLIDIPERMVDDATRTHYKDLTVEQFRGLVDGVKSLEHIGREMLQVTDGDIQRSLDEVAQEAKEAAGALPQTKRDSNRGQTLMAKKFIGMKESGRSFLASMLKMEQMTDWLDNHNPLGIFNRMVFRKIADAEGRRNDLDLKITGKWGDFIKKLPPDLIKASRGIYEMEGCIDGITGETQRLDWSQKMMLAGIRGDAGAFDKLLRGEKWDADSVIRFLDQNMTAEEWQFIKGLSDTFADLFPLKQEMMRSLGATAPKAVDRIGFKTRHGDMPGWYWPIKYDPSRSQIVKEMHAKDIEDLHLDNVYSPIDTSTGREVTRNESFAKPMLLSIEALPRIVKDEIRDITMRREVLEVQRFLKHPEVRKAITGALSEQHYDKMLDWLRSVANDAASSPSELQFWENLAHGARVRTTMVGLGLRITTMGMHAMTAAAESVAEAGPKAMLKGVMDSRSWTALTHLGPEWLQKGISNFVRSDQFEANRNFIFERSAEMRHRTNEIERDQREKLQEINLQLMSTAVGAVERAKLAIQARAYQGIAMLDMASALPTWMGAYLKGIEKAERGGLGMSEQDAIYFADKTVRNAHGGGGVKDMAAVQRGGELWKLATMFYTFWSHNANRLMDTGRRIGQLPTTYDQARASGEWGKFRGDVGSLVLRSFIYTFMVQSIHHMFNPPKDDGKPETWLAWFGKMMANSLAGGVPVARDLVPFFTGSKDYEMSPVASIATNTQTFLKDMEGKSSGKNYIKHALTETGYITGLPLGQVGATTQFMHDVWDGRQRPQDIADWWRGVTSGDMHKR